MTLRDQLVPLASRAWTEFATALSAADGVVVRPSMPILYFGDSVAYDASPFRVITVGLNPSRREFPPDDPWLRFPRAGDIAPHQIDEYLGSLDDYFRVRPYDGWFAPGFEPVLRGLGTSYYGGRSVALHTDLFSPVATDPTWSKLGERRLLMGNEGPRLWRELVNVLRPDLIVASLAERHLEHVSRSPVPSWPIVYVLERKNPYAARMTKAQVGERAIPILFGRAAQLPFGTISAWHKKELGAAVRKVLDGK